MPGGDTGCSYVHVFEGRFKELTMLFDLLYTPSTSNH